MRTLISLLALIAVAACDRPESPADTPMTSAPSPAVTSEAAAGRAASMPPALSDVEGSAGVPSGEADLVERMLIRMGTTRIEVVDLDSSIARAYAIVHLLGGEVASTSRTGGRDGGKQATLELRIPAARFDSLQSAIASLGTLELLNVTAQDVGEEYVDLNARLENQQRLETRLLELLRTRTGKLDDVLKVERELARVREQIERLQGRLRYLRTRVATSVLSVELHEPEPVIGGRGSPGVMVEAFRTAWRNFVGFVALLIAGSGVFVPIVILGGAVVLAIRYWQGHR